MSWKDLLQKDNETIQLPWVGGRNLRSRSQTWVIQGALPREFGWYSFRLKGREAVVMDTVDPATDVLSFIQRGYLIGDRVMPDGVSVKPNAKDIIACSEKVFLLDEGLDRFARVVTGRVYENGPLIFKELDMPLGPEADVMTAFLDLKLSVSDIKGVPPALDAAFRMESWQREQREQRRLFLEEQRRLEEEKRAQEERRQKLAEALGSGAGRRQMALVDFREAARAALAVGGAVFLDERKVRNHEREVRYRVDQQRLACLCDERTLRIVDSGICLVDHTTGEKGDTYFTLESLPTVVRQAMRERRLVVYRHF